MCKHLPTLTKPPLLSGESVAQKRAHLKTYFRETWELYESLFSLINDDNAYYLRPEPLRHPLIFYYGHTAVFYINKFMLGKYIDKRINPNLESICAVGVDEMSWDDLKPDNYQWPDVNDVREYRNQVKALILDMIEQMPLELPIRKDSLAWVMLMGIEHERIHIETSSVIMRMMDLKYLDQHDKWQSCKDTAKAPSNTLLAVFGKTLQLGKPGSNDTYGWDNEYGSQEFRVEDFKASEFLVSNAEFMGFIEAGGYQNNDYWTEEGQNWLGFTKARMPRFWSYRDGQYWQRNLLEEVPVTMDWPAEVNYLEAKAFCNWKSESSHEYVRLPTEPEWQVLRDQLDVDLPNWPAAPGNINLEHFASSCPVNAFQQGEFYDVIGNVWQWTESPIDGFEGFEVHPLYDDFSTPTFDGKHNLMKGGSWISTGNEATRDSRYAFRRHFFQHAGFRYVSSPKAGVPIIPVNCFETQPEISQMLNHQYGQAQNDLTQLATIIQENVSNAGKALDIGCGTGRLSFELAKKFDQVDGLDFTARHIQHALQLKEQGQLRYAINVEGELQSFHEVNLEELGFATIASKVTFLQGDGHNLKPQFTGYDLIVCHRVIDEVYNPVQFLQNLAQRLNKNGVLVISSAWQWQEDKVEKAHWLGGFKRDGENLTSIEGIKELLAENFDLLRHSNIETRLQINPRRAELLDNDMLLFRKK
jgi:5-histidylcysteine sulfoxide synthase/putative 4-mercaptohistidine N1-methyltranferase